MTFMTMLWLLSCRKRFRPEYVSRDMRTVNWLDLSASKINFPVSVSSPTFHHVYSTESLYTLAF